jgi:NADH dehydrogenase
VAWNVVIAGGGFGGAFAAQTLKHRLPRHVARFTRVNDVNFLLYTPLMPGAAGGTLDPRHIVVPLREAVSGIDLRLGRVTGLDAERRRLKMTALIGEADGLAYDQLIVALGSVSRTLPISGLAGHAIGFKSVSEAIALRNHVIAGLERAESLGEDAGRAAHLTFVFVGGGYAGVEGPAELRDFVADALRRYPRCRLQGVRCLLVEAKGRIMGEVDEDLADFTVRELRGRGIEILTGTTVKEVTATDVRLSNGERVPTRTVVWTAGVKPHPVVSELGLPLGEDDRLRTDACLRVAGGRAWCGQSATPPACRTPLESREATASVDVRSGRGRPLAFVTGRAHRGRSAP